MNLIKAQKVYRENIEARHLYYWGLFVGFLGGFLVSMIIFT